ncbi:hypothetical protein T8K17_22550 [Thalassobaculum sp. OXR-137]|uniref:hypothetical protein n=1 Tax=Thalassobaculum sp. OXR-137 TaxID=3100173 RepID=UPI002AC91D41|nr:hypothetical protein [Thalassobaculum sp. OXR-137]WPZ34007.1 hypothetical protein T8K17_22550 [Thalassobaculum sp. OXR-137]
MKSAIAAFLIVLTLPNVVLGATFTFKNCSPDTTITAHSFNYNDPVRMVAASSAYKMREGDMRTLNCPADMCFVKTHVTFLNSDEKRVIHNVRDMVTDGGSVCLKMRPNTWNTDEATVSYGQCSC